MSETPSDIPADVAARVQSELLPGETIMWMGQPDPHMPPGFYFALALGAAFFGAFGYSFLSAAIQTGNNLFGWIMAVLAAVFFVGVVYLISLPWTMRIWARKSVYVITDRRALTFNWRIKTAVRHYQPEQLRDSHIERRRQDVANIVLTSEFKWWRVLVASQGMKTKRYFINIREPDAALAMLRVLAGVDANA